MDMWHEPHNLTQQTGEEHNTMNLSLVGRSGGCCCSPDPVVELMMSCLFNSRMTRAFRSTLCWE